MELKLAKDLKDFRERALKEGFDVVTRVVPQKYLACFIPTYFSSELDRIILGLSKSAHMDFLQQAEGVKTARTPHSAKKRKYSEELDLGNPTSQFKTWELSGTPSGCESHSPSSDFVSLDDMRELVKTECELMVHLTVGPKRLYHVYIAPYIPAKQDQTRLWLILALNNSGTKEPKDYKGFKSLGNDRSMLTKQRENSGVTQALTPDIQDDLLVELNRAQTSALNMRSTAHKERLVRAKICTKLLKYPATEDYMLALREHDEEYYFLSHQHLKDLRTIYVALHDAMQRNGLTI